MLSMLVSVFTKTITWTGILEALIPLLYAGLMSGAVAYTLQIIGQRDTDPTVASLIMCLESVFATLSGALILGEKMTVRETVGCVLMFVAVVLAQLSPVISSIRRGGRSHR
jgi:drug/metabolite transporter (DMT)-like permease